MAGRPVNPIPRHLKTSRQQTPMKTGKRSPRRAKKVAASRTIRSSTGTRSTNARRTDQPGRACLHPYKPPFRGETQWHKDATEFLQIRYGPHRTGSALQRSVRQQQSGQARSRQALAQGRQKTALPTMTTMCVAGVRHLLAFRWHFDRRVAALRESEITRQISVLLPKVVSRRKFALRLKHLCKLIVCGGLLIQDLI